MKLLDVTIRESTYLKKGFNERKTLDYLKEYSKLMPFNEVDSLELCFLDNHINDPFFYNPKLITSAREVLDEKYGLVSVLHPKLVDLSKWDRYVLKCFSCIRFMINAEIDSNCEKIIYYLHELGIPVSINVIYISKKDLGFIDKCLELCRRNNVEIFTVADSSGHCLPYEIKRIMEHIYSRGDSFEINLHLHNHMGLALANAIECREFVDYLDGSINGYGKGGGNLELERIIFALRQYDRVDVKPYEIEKYIDLYRYLVREIICDDWTLSIEKLKNMLIGFYDLNLKQIDEIDSIVNYDPEAFCLKLVSDYCIQ